MSAVALASTALQLTQPKEFIATGVAGFDTQFKGVPRGGITEIAGTRSSGRTTLMMSIFANATASGGTCALVDTCGNFHPASAAASGVKLDQLLRIRCDGNPGDALRIADLLVQSSGFGVIGLDLADVPVRLLNRIPISYWHRFRLALENRPTVLLVISEYPNVKSCTARAVECSQEGVRWSGAGCGRLLQGVNTNASLRKPMRPGVSIYATAV